MLAKLNKIASSDHNTCEDNFMVYENDEIIQGVVADGCSTGKHSSFISRLICDLFKVYSGGDITNNNSILEIIYYNLLPIKSLLQLSENRLWSTILIFRYNKLLRELRLRTFGDGVYYVNNEEFIIDQDDKVDYLLSHLDKPSEYLQKNSLKIFYDVKSFAICSDGINSFSFPEFKEVEESKKIDPKKLLLSENTSKNHLERKYNIIKKQGWQNRDDLTIISYHE